MNRLNLPSQSAAAPSAAVETPASRALAITFAALLGAFVVGGVGFSHIAAAHNAAHDVRHAVAFPCH
ncbi:cobalt transporter subunit CbtB [Ancylobacter sp. 3268]|uniref:CbtB domain-containing protein n=1 Tax=Ancylobacter sp. 3268 TaxID=2817752 RepID=UPI002860B061|nr:CbtB-domain containing protein [Ancylobacter sp. 3268]MDR6951616.1 cobalt transporter subunit CbtB [Ancylobacter sp. 3268]